MLISHCCRWLLGWPPCDRDILASRQRLQRAAAATAAQVRDELLTTASARLPRPLPQVLHSQCWQAPRPSAHRKHLHEPAQAARVHHQGAHARKADVCGRVGKRVWTQLAFTRYCWLNSRLLFPCDHICSLYSRSFFENKINSRRILNWHYFYMDTVFIILF